MKKNYFSRLLIVLGLFILFTLISAKSYANYIFNDLSNNIFRLHILANSDSSEDQELKLKVRDEIIKYIQNLTKDSTSKSEVISICKENINELQLIAEQTILNNGYSYPVTVQIGNFYFPTKYYGNVSMPAGYYDALRIKIGEAKGQNWWCSLFPALCFTDVSNGVIDSKAKDNLSNNLNDEEMELILSKTPKIKFKFKLIEMLNAR